MEIPAKKYGLSVEQDIRSAHFDGAETHVVIQDIFARL